jgi:hypothetical protein
MSRATLGFSEATRTRSRRSPRPYVRARALMGTGQGLSKTHGKQIPYRFAMGVNYLGFTQWLFIVNKYIFPRRD